MKTKIIMGLILSSVMTLVLWQGGWALFLFSLTGFSMAMWEYYKLLQQKEGSKPLVFVGIAFGGLFMALPFIEQLAGPLSRNSSSISRSSDSIGAVISLYVLIVLLIQFWQIMTHRARYTIVDLSLTVFGSLYIGMLGSFIVHLMNVSNAHFPESEHLFLNRLVIFMPMWASWGTDVGAYFFGSFLGRNRIFPELSPKKTLEGSIGGIVTSAIGMCVISIFIHIPFLHALVLGLVASTLGQIGDLSESAFKRELGIKDTGRVFAGHGGFLDRIDSFLFTAPVIYYYFAWFQPWR